MASVREIGSLEVQVRPDRDRVIVEVSGEVDVASVGRLQEALDDLRAHGWEHIVLDLREVSFIDSTGLSLLLDAERSARRQGASFAIVDGAPAVARLLEIVGLKDHFTRARVR
jgi:anti-sigma B factor antagonist